MKRRILTAIWTLAALTLAGCGSTHGGEAATSGTSGGESSAITVGLTYIPDIQFAPFYVAEEKGYFTEAGLHVTLRHHGAQEALLGPLQSGKEDVVFAGGDEMMQARSNGTDVVDWATMYQQYPVKLISLAPANTGTGLSPKDIKGKTIGLPGPYGANYYALLAMLADQGLTEKDVTIAYIGYTQAAALLWGDVDAVVGYTNSDATAITTAVAAAGRNDTTVQEDMVPGGLPLVGVGLGSLSDNLATHRDDYRKMLGALDKAVAYAKENPEETVKISEKYVPSLAEPEARDQALKVLAATLPLYEGNGAFGGQDAARWQEMATFMWEKGLLAKKVEASEAFVDLTKD